MHNNLGLRGRFTESVHISVQLPQISCCGNDLTKLGRNDVKLRFFRWQFGQ